VNVLPAGLPSVRTAKIPATYNAAKTAISECARVDECKDWADKAEALASYAKQAEDGELRQMADRIQARAIRRCGELFREMAPKVTAGRPPGNCAGTVTISRTKAAKDAGLSRRQKVTALRVSNVPVEEFEAAVESDSPPTVTELADRGREPSTAHLKGRDPKDFKASTQVQGNLRRFAEFVSTADPQTAVRGAFKRERADMLRHAEIAQKWLTLLARCIRE